MREKLSLLKLVNNSPLDYRDLRGTSLETATGANGTAFSGSSDRTYSVFVKSPAL